MSRNKIGIEVQVEFPTVKELQSQLADKWRSVKRDFEGKINVGVDGHSMSQIRKKIQDALDDKVFDLKLDSTGALKNIANVRRELKELDAKIDKTREIKIGVNLTEMDKSFKEILENNQKIEKAVEKQNKAHQETTGHLNAQIASATKFQRIQKQLKDGTVVTTMKWKEDSQTGRVKDVTRHPDGRVDVSHSEDRLKLVKEIEGQLKRVHAKEIEISKAQGDQKTLLEMQLQDEDRILKTLKEEYKERHKVDSVNEKSIKHLIEQHEIQLEIKDAIQRQKKEQSDVADAISRVAKLEKEKHKIAMKMVTALEDEKAHLKEQYDFYSRAQKAIDKKYSVQEQMTKEQQEELSNLKRINALEEQRAHAKKDQKENEAKLTQEQKERQALEERNLNEVLDTLKDIHRIREKIAQLEAKSKNGGTLSNGEKERLSALKSELNIAGQSYKQTLKEYKVRDGITDELKSQLKTQKEINQQEMRRIEKAGEAQAHQNKLNRDFKEQERISARITQLQRDLVFSGMREEVIIESQIKRLEEKRGSILDNLRSQNAINKAQEEEIAHTERLQREQMQLNRLRQDAREKDRAYNDTGGLIDPNQFAIHAERGAMSVYDSIARLDEALIGVTKVADATEEQFKSFAETSYDVGSSLGVTADEYILATEKWVTAGKNFQESQELAQISMTGAFVGNIEPDKMVKYMAVPMEAYKDSALEANDIINAMNETANTNAIEMEDMGKAYVRSATTAKMAGVSFEELSGFITSAQEATRKGGERIGTSIKTMGMNIQMLASGERAIDKKKADWFESKLGIDMRDVEGKAKSMTQILSELQAQWDTMASEDKSTAVYNIAGKEHAETMNGILSQWDTFEEVVKTTGDQLGQGLDGSAYLEHAKQADSVKFKVAELKNAWDELMFTIGGGQGGIADVLGAMTEGLEVLNDLAKNEQLMRVLKYILAGVAISAGANAWKRLFDTVITGLGAIKRDMKEVKTLSGTMFPAGGVGVVGGVDGSDDDKDKKKKGKTSSGGGSTFVPIGGLGGRKKATKETDNIDKANGKLKTGLRLGGRLLSMIPVLGQALLIADLAGVDIFGGMLNKVKEMVTSSEEMRVNFEEADKKFRATNQITNGNLEDKENTFYGEKTFNEETEKYERKGGFREQYQEGRESDGFLSEEEFAELQEKINKFAQENGFIDIELKLNNDEEIKSTLDEIEEKLKELAEAEVDDLGAQYDEQFGIIADAYEDMGERMGEASYLKEKIEEEEKIIQKYQDRIDAGEELTKAEEIQLERARGNYNGYVDKLAEVEEDIQGNKDIIADATDNMALYSDRLIQYIDSGGKLTGMTHDQVKSALLPMIDKYKSLSTKIGEAKDATELLTSSKKLEEDQWEKIQGLHPSLMGMSDEQINKDKAKRDEALKIIQTKGDELKANQDVVRNAINGATEHIGAEKDVQFATDGTMKLTGDLKDEIKAKNDEINKTPTEKTTTWYFKVKESVSNFFRNMWNELKSTDFNLSVGGTVSNSVSTAEGEGGVGAGSGTSSASVSSVSGKPTGRIIGQPTRVSSIDRATSLSDDARVSSDIWRYWGSEMKIEDITQKINDLTQAIHKANDNEKELIKLYKQQNKTLKSQEDWYNKLSGQKQSEMNEVLKDLRGYGFKTSGNDISNLGLSKNFKGEKATEVEDLLNTWKALGADLTSISDSIASLNETIKDNTEAIEEAQIILEAESFEGQVKRINALLNSVSNSDNMFGQKLGFISDLDKELGLKQTESAMNASKANMSALINEFNKLSTATIKYEENGESLQSQLDGLASEILKQSDAIIEYQESLNELEISRVASDMEKFNDAVDRNTDKVQNNIDNLKEGLLSDTSLTDLQSVTASSLGFDRNNEYEESAKERIALEQEVQEALEGFAKMNVDRQGKVANETLRINSNMYGQLLKMQESYTNGEQSVFTQIQATIESLAQSVRDDSYELANNLEGYFGDIKAKQDELLAQYQRDMSYAVGADQKDSIANQYILDSLKVQEEYMNAIIESNRDAIANLNEQLKDSTLTDEQEQAIRDQIKGYEDGITDAQNNIKDIIRDRFDFEFSLLNESIAKYDEYTSKLEYSLDILNSIGGDNNSAMGKILDKMMSFEEGRNSELSSTISSLEKQMRLYEEGSYEWNILNEQVKEYKESLRDSNVQLLEMNKNIMSNSFAGTLGDLEKTLFNGKTLSELNRHRELWMEGLEREIALEDTYQRLADLGTKIHDEKMEQLAKQEKLSRFEMEYLNKQLDVLDLQQKLENLNKERTVQILKEQADGTWDWSYEGDATQISNTQDELKQAQLELQRAEEEAQESYLGKLEDILSDAEDGGFKSVRDLENALTQLGTAYESVVGDIPEIQDEYLRQLLDAYSQYITGNEDILAGVNAPVVSDTSFDKFRGDIIRVYDKISKNIGDTIYDYMSQKFPVYTTPVERPMDKSVSIHLDKIDFPNVTSSDGIKDAIMSLPQIALQKSKEK